MYFEWMKTAMVTRNTATPLGRLSKHGFEETQGNIDDR